MRTAEYQRGYDAGYKAALLEALRLRERERSDRGQPIDTVKLGGPDAPYKQTPEWRRRMGGG